MIGGETSEGKKSQNSTTTIMYKVKKRENKTAVIGDKMARRKEQIRNKKQTSASTGKKGKSAHRQPVKIADFENLRRCRSPTIHHRSGKPKKRQKLCIHVRRENVGRRDVKSPKRKKVGRCGK